jgi:hypothetical protein
MNRTNPSRRAAGPAAFLAVALAAPAAAADRAALHAAIQGRWHADNKQVAEQVPGWKDMSADQRGSVMAMLPILNFEITADRIVWKATSPDEEDEPLAYTIAGVEGAKLKLSGRNSEGEQKTFTLEVLGPDTLRLTSPDAPSLRLQRDVAASPPPPPPAEKR